MAKGFLGNRTIIALSFITLLLGLHTAHAAKRKRATSPAQAPSLPAEPSITYLPAISQGAYEANPQHNLYKGNALCGLFATFNAACMLDDAHNRPRQKKLSWVQDIARFNTWLKQRETIVQQLIEEAESRPRPAERGFGNLHEGELSRLLSLPSDNFYRENSTFLELENLHTYFVTENRTNHFVPPSDDLIEAINLYRTTRTPHAIIFNTGGHWIAILLAADGSCTVADSINAGTANKRHVRTIYRLFTQQPLLPAARLAQLRQQYGRSEDASTTSEEEESSSESDASSSDSDSDDEEIPASQLPEEPRLLNKVAYKKAKNGEKNLKGTKLCSAKLVGLHLEGADFSYADLRGADFTGAYLDGATFKGALLDDTIFTGAQINDGIFTDARLNGTIFTEAVLQNAQFININKNNPRRGPIRSVRFDRADMTGALISNSDLSGSCDTLSDTKNAGAVFSETILTSTVIEHTNLSRALLTDIHLTSQLQIQKVELIKATVRNILFSNAKLLDISWSGVVIDGLALIESVVRNNRFNRMARISRFYSQSTILINIDFSNSRISESIFIGPIIKRHTSPLDDSKEKALAYYTCYLGFNLIFNGAQIRSTVFLGNLIAKNASLKNHEQIQLFENDERDLFQHIKKLEKYKDEKSIVQSYSNNVHDVVLRTYQDVSTMNSYGAIFTVIGVVVGVTATIASWGALAPLAAATETLQATAATAVAAGGAGIGTGALSGGVVGVHALCKTPSEQNFNIRNRTILHGTSFKHVQFDRVIFGHLNILSAEDLNTATFAGGSIFEKCFMPNEQTSQRLRDLGAKVNGYANDTLFWKTWGANPKDPRCMQTIVNFFSSIGRAISGLFGVNLNVENILTELFQDNDDDN